VVSFRSTGPPRSTSWACRSGACAKPMSVPALPPTTSKGRPAGPARRSDSGAVEGCFRFTRHPQQPFRRAGAARPAAAAQCGSVGHTEEPGNSPSNAREPPTRTIRSSRPF